jgi:uncharacterized membrane protein
MKAVSHFLRTTILGGALFLMPIVVLAFLPNKAFEYARRGLKPVAKLIPDQLVSGATMETVMAIGLIVLLCFLAGLFARTALAQRIMSELEAAVLSNVPAYEYLKQAGSSMMGLGEMADHPVVLAQIEGAWRLGVQTSVAESGLTAVFIPNSPNTFSGSVFFVASDKVRRLNVPLRSALGCLEQLGAKGGSFLANLTLADSKSV